MGQTTSTKRLKQGGFIQTEKKFQSLSPRGGEEWKWGQNLWFWVRNQDLRIFLFSDETTLLVQKG